MPNKHYIYKYIYVYIYIYIYIYVCVCVNIFLNTCMCVHLYIHNKYTQYTHILCKHKLFIFGCDESFDSNNYIMFNTL